jgi:hypothetical protein
MSDEPYSTRDATLGFKRTDAKMLWKLTLAAGAAALFAPVSHMAGGALEGAGKTIEVSGGGWTGEVRTLRAPQAGFDDPTFAARVEAAAQEVCTPTNLSLRIADREQACIADVLAGVRTRLSAQAAVR